MTSPTTTTNNKGLFRGSTTTTAPPVYERVAEAEEEEERVGNITSSRQVRQVNNFLTRSQLGSVSLLQQDCCLFLFLDGSAHYFDTFLKERTGEYQLQPGKVNGRPHYANRECQIPGRYGSSCFYVWFSNGRWVAGEGRYIGDSKGVMYTSEESDCPTDLAGWRYLDSDLSWRSDGRITVHCAA